MMGNMETPLALAVRQSTPEELYRIAFRHFRELFRARPDADVSAIQLPSHLPENADAERAKLGALITGALLAMLDHTVTGDWSNASLAEIPVYVKLMMPVEIQHRLDTIIMSQAKITGTGLLTSDLVMARALEWERHDYAKAKRWLRALDKAARVHSRKMAAPLADPYYREVKQKALEELRPALARLRRWFEQQRRPTKDEIVEAFAREAQNAGPFLANNLEVWMRFCHSNVPAFLDLSAENLFDAFVGFVTKHDPEYVRKSVSSL